MRSALVDAQPRLETSMALRVGGIGRLWQRPAPYAWHRTGSVRDRSTCSGSSRRSGSSIEAQCRARPRPATKSSKRSRGRGPGAGCCGAGSRVMRAGGRGPSAGCAVRVLHAWCWPLPESATARWSTPEPRRWTSLGVLPLGESESLDARDE